MFNLLLLCNVIYAYVDFCGKPSVCVCTADAISCTGSDIYSLPVFNELIRARTKTIYLDKTSIDNDIVESLVLFTRLEQIQLKDNIMLCSGQNTRLTDFGNFEEECLSTTIRFTTETIPTLAINQSDNANVSTALGGVIIDHTRLKIDLRHVILISICSLALIGVICLTGYVVRKHVIRNRTTRHVIYIPMTDVLAQSEE